MKKTILILLLILLSITPTAAEYNSINTVNISTENMTLTSNNYYELGNLVKKDAFNTDTTGDYPTYDISWADGVIIQTGTGSRFNYEISSTTELEFRIDINNTGDNAYTGFGTGLYGEEGSVIYGIKAEASDPLIFNWWNNSVTTDLDIGGSLGNWYEYKLIRIDNYIRGYYRVQDADSWIYLYGNHDGDYLNDGLDYIGNFISSSSGDVYFDNLFIKTLRYNGNLTSDIQDCGSGEYLDSLMWNGTETSNTTVKIYVNTSDDLATWTGEILVEGDASPYTLYNVSGSNNQKYYIAKTVTTTTLIDETTVIKELIGVESTSITPPNITSYISTDTTPITYENIANTYTATSDQTANFSFKIDSTEYQFNESVLTASYYNSTMLNGTYNVSVSVTNDNGTDQQDWSQLMLLNSFDMYIINETSTLMYFTPSNYTAGLPKYNIAWDDRANNGTANTSTLYYQNGTSITSNSTYVDNSVLLVPPYKLPSDTTYYIQESTTWTLVAGSIFQDIIHTIFYNGTVTYSTTPTQSSINLSAVFEPRMEVL